LVALVLATFLMLVVGIIGLVFSEPCTPAETGIGIFWCVHMPGWTGPLEVVVFLTTIGFVWWSSRYWGGGKDRDRSESSH
jgi:hypothetical protein